MMFAERIELCLAHALLQRLAVINSWTPSAIASCRRFIASMSISPEYVR
jgi:hypothetical protein